MKINTLKNLNIKNKRIFLRADLNVPLQNNQILQDFKLKSILPTLNYIIKKGCKIILATHLGSPKTKEQAYFFDKNLSTQILAKWFLRNNYQIGIEAGLQKAVEKSKQDFDKILLLENLRFFSGEKEDGKEFAVQLYKLADFYVNDAFGVCHRNDTSVTLLPELFEKNQKSFGILIEKEIINLIKIKENPEQPFVLVLGGNKISDKISMLNSFIEKPQNNRPQIILIGGKIAEAFLDETQVEKEDIKMAKEIIKLAENQNVKIILPKDKVSIDGRHVDIGEQTIKLFEEQIKKAKTIFANGTMGIYQKNESQNGTEKILQAIANCQAYSVIGGGDAVAATHIFNFQNKMNFLSTGGGATLKFLASKNPLEELPGLKSCLE